MTEARPDIRERFGMADSGGHARLALRMSCLALLCCLTAFVFALVPVGVHVETAADVHIHRSEAVAVEVVDNPLGYITECAQAVGMTESKLVATVIGIASASSGINLVTGPVGLNNNLTENLEALAYTADYPDYDLLPEEEKQGWGNRTNYDAAKFNALMKALGLSNSVDGWYASGGNSVDFDESELRILDHVQEIGQTWLNRGSVALSQLREVAPPSQVTAFAGTHYATIHYEGDDWPTTVSKDVVIGIGNELRLQGNYYSTYMRTSQTNYWLPGYAGSSGVYITFSKDYFSYQYNYSTNPTVPTNLSRSASQKTLSGKNFTYYSGGGAGGGFNGIKSCNMKVNNFGSASTDDLHKVAGLILYSEESGNPPEQNYTPIEDYPSDGEPTTINVYYPTNIIQDPETGEEEKKPEIVPETTWPEYITIPTWEEPEPQPSRPDNPYNPQNPDPETGEPTTGTGTPEWREETTENILPLMDIKFDQLFPFSMLFDISKMFDKVEEMTQAQSGSGVYSQIVIPIQWGGDDVENMVLDLAWLYQLLIMVRVFNQLLLAALLLFTAISFWRTILTG